MLLVAARGYIGAEVDKLAIHRYAGFVPTPVEHHPFDPKSVSAVSGAVDCIPPGVPSRKFSRALLARFRSLWSIQPLNTADPHQGH
jgi:hypothetical protein